MTDRVTLYRVRRPDGAVIDEELQKDRIVALNRASNKDSELHHLWWIQDRTIQYLEERGYTIETVEYAPVNPEREAAIKMMRDVLAEAKKRDLFARCCGEVECACANVSPTEDPEALLIWIDWISRKATAALAAFDKAEGAK